MTGTFDGLTQGDVLPGETPVVDFSATPKIDKSGVELYPVNSEFGFVVTDFDGAISKDFITNPEYEEGFVGDIFENGEQVGLMVSDAPTDTFKTPALLGTWLAGLGGNTVKASTEHYSVMQAILSDQKYPEDPTAVYQLDDNLKMIGGTYDGQFIEDILPIVGDVNEDGVVDIKDVLVPNESTIRADIAVGNDYSVTMKDDGKLLYRWGNTIKRPNDVRLEATLDLPDEWGATDYETSVMSPVFQITAAELAVRHTITNNPNDQLRPEDFENEAARGTLPDYEELADGSWVSKEGFFAGDGTFLPAGTVLKDPTIPGLVAGSTLDRIGSGSVDLDEGFTNAYYTTMDREPFEPELNAAGDAYVSGPRWRLQSDKYGQDLPSVVMPIDPRLTANPTQDQVKYDVGADTQTVINLLDWAQPVSPLDISLGWQNKSGTVSANGLNMTNDFDLAIYIKGDVKPASIYDATLLLDYDEVAINALGTTVTGTAQADILVGEGGNTMTGGTGGDLFLLSYGALSTAAIVANTINDFEVGVDAIGFAGLGVDDTNFDTKVTQTVVGGDLQIAIDGVLIATLIGVTAPLDMADDFRLMTGPDLPDNLIAGTSAGELLVGDAFSNTIAGLGGDDTIQGLGSGDVLYGGAGDDSVLGGDGNDVIYGGTGNDSIFGEGGFDWLYGGAGNDSIVGGSDTDMASFVDSTDGVTINLAAGTAVSGSETDTLSDIENVTGSSFADVITGDDNGNWLRGLGHFDWFNGSGGNDTIDGGSGQDMISYVASTEAVTVDLGAGTGTAGLALGDTYVSVERATGSVYGDTFFGGDGAEQFRGLGGYDLFHGSGGGKDIYDGGSGLDTLSYAASTSGVKATLLFGFGWVGDADDDLYTSIENLIGSNSGDELIGDGGRNNLQGLLGNDTLDGGADVDRLTGGGGDDFIDGGWGWDYAHFSENQDQYSIST
ncbi:MAG: calcium-binding protein, partial [Roseovarius sp.]|nr:calcium-binding protein [Roseovarius sp.]